MVSIDREAEVTKPTSVNALVATDSFATSNEISPPSAVDPPLTTVRYVVLAVTAEVKAVVWEFAALDGALDIKPKPNAATVASAIRFKVVFVDICFLSLVVKKTFFSTAGKERLFAS
jgi:hypothetical protein